MNNQRLHRANSFIRAREERAGIVFKNRMLFNRKPAVQTQDVFGSFLTIPNAFKQCTITLLIIHSAISNALKEKPPDSSVISLNKIDRMNRILWDWLKLYLVNPVYPVKIL